MPFTLADHAAAQTEKLKKGVYLGIIQEGVIPDILSFSSTSGLSKTGVRYDGVNEPDFIPINGTIAEKSQRGKNLSFGVYELALHLDIPEPLERDDGVIEKPSTRQAMLALRGAAYKVNDQFVNGDQAVDPNGFEGIVKILGNLAAAQTVGATEIDISGAPTDAVIQSFIDRIDEAIDAIDGHKPTFALCNRQFGLRARSMFRRADLLGNDEDWIRDGFPFGDQRKTLQTKSTDPMFIYQKIPFYDLGVRADQTTQIITNAYAEGGSATATRLFFVKAGEDNVEGLQRTPPSITDVGMLHDKNVRRRRFLWDLGLGVWGSRSLSLAAGIKVT